MLRVITFLGIFISFYVGQAFAQQKLFWSTVENDNAIYTSNLDGSSQQKIVDANNYSGGAKDLWVDDTQAKIYWINPPANEIRRANLDGTTDELVYSSANPIAQMFMDRTARKLYFMDPGGPLLNRINFDGTGFESTSGAFSSYAIATGPAVGKIFFHIDPSSIFQAPLEPFGSSPSSFDSESVVSAMNYIEGMQALIWFSNFTESIRIRSLSALGPSNLLLFTNSEDVTAFAYDRDETTLYWADGGTQSISKTSFSSPAAVPVLTTIINPSGIAISCGRFAPDADSDGRPDCDDRCPSDAAKIEAGVCGCGTADIDTDSDGTLDCSETCDSDSLKTAPGLCGCGEVDSLLDSDFDGALDCNDNCPADSKKTEPGLCGCGFTEVTSSGQAACTDNLIVDPKTKIDEPPQVEVEDRTITLILQKFTKAALKKKKAKPQPELLPFLLAAKRDKITFRYQVKIQNISKKNDIKQITSKRNELTVKNLKPGSYNVSYRAEIFRNGEPAGRTNFSPKANFTIN